MSVHLAKRWIMRGRLMEWYTGHPDRTPCYCLATGDIVDNKPRFLLATQLVPRRSRTWRLWDRGCGEWISDDLGDDRRVARRQAEEIIRSVDNAHKAGES